MVLPLYEMEKFRFHALHRSQKGLHGFATTLYEMEVLHSNRGLTKENKVASIRRYMRWKILVSPRPLRRPIGKAHCSEGGHLAARHLRAGI